MNAQSTGKVQSGFGYNCQFTDLVIPNEEETEGRPRQKYNLRTLSSSQALQTRLQKKNISVEVHGTATQQGKVVLSSCQLIR